MSNVTTNIENGIANIVIDDGKVNAMSTPTMQEILAALDEAEAASAVAVVKGREGIFSAGFDMKTFAKGPEASLEMIQTGAELILRFLRYPFPVFTVCAGHAYPMGAFLMLSADARYGVRGDWNIGLNETAIGMTIPMFAIEVARHRLVPAAFQRASTAYLFNPEQALHAGYFDAIYDRADLDDAVQAEAERLRGLDMLNVTATKARINEPLIAAVEAGLKSEFGEPISA